MKWPKLIPNMGSGFIGLTLLLVTSVAIANQTSRSVWIIDANGAFSPSTAAAVLSKQLQAFQLRYLQTLSEIVGERTNTFVFPLPVDILGKPQEIKACKPADGQ